jgi:NAD(P)-dependent dehydrogenase (short-subunit alcohol dehydrogenase family)
MHMTKTVLITGGSTGIGAAAARLAARDGWDVALTYNSSRDAAEAVADEVRAVGWAALVLHCDVADPASIAAAYEALDADTTLAPLGALVNNAGIVDVAVRVHEMTPERLTRMFATNLTGAFLVAGAAVTRLSTAMGGPGGAIVNISSAAARLGSARQYVDYAASKAGVEMLTRGLADEVATEGVRVTAIRPGIIDTPIHGKGGEPDRADRMAAAVPMARKGSAEEVAEAIVWLISDKASYVTGTTLDVTGGR